METTIKSTEKPRVQTRSSRDRRSFNRHEAAFFAAVPVRQIDKAIEEKVVKPWRPNAAATYLDGADVLTVAVIAKAGVQLSRKTKKQIRTWIESAFGAPGVDHELALSDVLVLRLDSEIASMARRIDSYRERRERYIEANPEVQGGEPVLAGTRLPVNSVAARLKSGDSLDDLVVDYPGIPKTAFEAARIYAETHPRRGRPVRPWRDG
jgi:uncharacterized protein (DUF433 family)